MLTSDSMTLLWLTYLGLSLIVLLTGYLGLAFLPRVLRLPITWAVAGIVWVPTRFELPLVDSEVYTGLAPAVVVAGIALLEGNTPVMVSSGLLVAAGAGVGVALGLAQWWAFRSRHGNAAGEDDRRGRGGPHRSREREEPASG